MSVFPGDVDPSNPWAEWLGNERDLGVSNVNLSAPAPTQAGMVNPNPPHSGTFNWTATQNAETQTSDPTKDNYNPRDRNIENAAGNWFDYLNAESQKFQAEKGWNPFDASDLGGVIRNMSYADNKYTDSQLLQNVLQNWNQRDTNTPGSGDPNDGMSGSDGRTATSRPGGTGQTWNGENWFTDPATSQLETLIKGQLNQLSNPSQSDPQSQLMNFLMTRFQELAGSNGYSPQELAMLRTQGAEPIEDLRKQSQQRELERTARAGYMPTSGITRINQQQNDLDYDRMRTQASRDLAVQNVNERSNRLNQASQLGQLALNTQRGTQGQQLQLSTLLQQLPVQSLNQALAVLNGSSTPESLAQIVAQMNAQNQQQQYYQNQQQQQLWGGIGAALADLFD